MSVLPHKSVLPYKIEACVTSLSEALQAERAGADRIELCVDIALDGLTPPMELVEEAVKQLSIPVAVMLRPRAGNFAYDLVEFKQMIETLGDFKDLGISHFVTGMLTKSSAIHLDQIQTFCASAAPDEVTFHKAIDQCADLITAVGQLRDIPNLTTILTSGGALTAIQRVPTIKKMIQAADDQVTIMPAGKITASNLSEVHSLIGAKYYHGRKII